MKENMVILFTRIPIPGKTKTRLQPYLSGEECCLLQKAFLRDVYRALQGLRADCDIAVCYAPKGDPDELEGLLPNAHLFFPQRGQSLGERMYDAICRMLGAGYRRCLLIGSDLPLLRAQAVEDAFALLEERDLVACPTEDGGYYLIGMKEPCGREIFDLEYGVSTVFEGLLAAAAKAGKTCAVGAPTIDIDNREDLWKLTERLSQEDPSVCRETRKILREFFRDGGLHEHHRPEAYRGL